MKPKKLDARERQLIGMRYFKDMTADGDCGRDGNFPGPSVQDGKADSEGT